MKMKEYNYVYNTALIQAVVHLLNEMHFPDEDSKLLFLEIKKELFTLKKMMQDKVIIDD